MDPSYPLDPCNLWHLSSQWDPSDPISGDRGLRVEDMGKEDREKEDMAKEAVVGAA